MKKIIFIISLFCALITYSQHTLNFMDIIDEQFDSNGCTTSINLEFKVNHSHNIISGNPHKYVLYMRKYISCISNFTSKIIELGPTNGNSMTLTSENILITGNTEMWLMREYEKRVGTGRRGSRRQPTGLTAEIFKCVNDVDDDGVLNADDNCPNIYGNSSNFGCPGNPDLVIDERLSIQYSDCVSDCTSSIYNTAFLNDDVPIIYRFGGNATIKPLIIKNIGDGDPQINYTKVSFYLSSDRDLSSDDFKFANRTLHITPLPNMGESTPTSYYPSYGVSLEGLDIGKNRSYGTYFILIVIDEDNILNNSEINTSNNISRYKVKYTGTQPRKSSALTDMTVLDFTGRVMLKSKVENKSQAMLIFHNSNIRNGLYILKTYNNITLIDNVKLFKDENSLPKLGFER